jgi:SAM-dependent methyltransferase
MATERQVTAEDRYADFVRERHRPAHGRRTARSHAAFFVRLLQPGDRVLDVGCGPGSITVGLGKAVGPGGTVVGVDLDPGPARVPLVRADAFRLPFPDRSFDAVFTCAMLQHLGDPLGALREARRVCRPGAVVGIADADRGGVIVEPPDPWVDRGHEVLDRLRDGTSIHVGRQLRGLLQRAGFVDVRARSTGGGAGGPEVAALVAQQTSLFESPALADVVVERGIASRDELAEVAAAWRRWGEDPGATLAVHWFEATGRAPGGDDGDGG